MTKVSKDFWTDGKELFPNYELDATKQLRVAFVGAARSGKDTLADSLTTSMGLRWYEHTSIAFANALKELYATSFSHIETTSKPRDALVTLGNAYRAVDPLYWIRALDKTFQDFKDNPSNKLITVTDVRYPNEVKWCRDNGFVIIKVTASPEMRRQRAMLLGERLDTSNDGDTHIDNLAYDYEIVNGDLNEAITELSDIIKLYI